MAPCFTVQASESKKKNRETIVSRFLRADTQIRTGDLILTKDALYRLSYISIGNVWYLSILLPKTQVLFYRRIQEHFSQKQGRQTETKNRINPWDKRKQLQRSC